jgi:hypothetical protein
MRENKFAYKYAIETPEMKITLTRLGHRWFDNIKMAAKEIEREAV